MKKITISMLSVILSLAMISCDEDEPVQPSDKGHGYPIASVAYSWDQIVEELDNGNLIGYIELIRKNNNYLQVYGNRYSYIVEEIRPVAITYYAADATFWNTNNQLTTVGPNVVINAEPLSQYDLGQYTDEGEIEFYYGNGWNKFLIDSNSVFDKVMDSLQFAAGIEITNISQYDTLDISDGFEVQWTGTPPNVNNMVYLSFDASYYPVDYQVSDSSFIGLQLPTPNDHSFRIGGVSTLTLQPEWTKHVLSNLVKDMHYDITIAGFQYYYIPTSIGKDILVLMITESKRTMYVKD